MRDLRVMAWVVLFVGGSISTLLRPNRSKAPLAPEISPRWRAVRVVSGCLMIAALMVIWFGKR